MKNPYTQPLESFSFDEMSDALDAISAETNQLDFKEMMIPKNELAYRACSFANAEGGLIVVGIKDPVEGQSLAFADSPPATGDKERMRVVASVNSRVHPALPMDVMGYQSVDGTKAVLVLRIRRSVIAPHEYTGGSEKHNLPVRRGTSTGRLGLSEIAILQMRREDASKSPIEQKRHPYFGIQPAGAKDAYVGLSISPKIYSPTRRVMDVVDDHLCMTIEAETRAVANAIHGEMDIMSLPDSNVLMQKGWQPHTGSIMMPEGHQYLGPNEQIEFFSDGDIVIRRVQSDDDATKQVIHMLLWGYATAQEVFFAFGLAPEARFRVICRFDKRRFGGVSPATDAYEDSFEVNLSTQGFAEAFLETMIRFRRASNGSAERNAILEVLQSYSDVTLSLGDALRPRWLES